jgi:hypothetical protein
MKEKPSKDFPQTILVRVSSKGAVIAARTLDELMQGSMELHYAEYILNDRKRAKRTIVTEADDSELVEEAPAEMILMRANATCKCGNQLVSEGEIQHGICDNCFPF